MTDEIRIEDALGVCSVREDTRLLAEMSYGATEGSRNPCRALDLGTGSGYVGVYLALKGWQVEAVDVSPRALALARRNAELNGVAPRIYQSNLFSDVHGPYDVIAFNPPMRGDETEGSRLVTATLRRVGTAGERADARDSARSRAQTHRFSRGDCPRRAAPFGARRTASPGHQPAGTSGAASLRSRPRLAGEPDRPRNPGPGRRSIHLCRIFRRRCKQPCQ